MRAVARDGNRAARDLIFEVFEVGDRKWRGVGSIPKSGYKLRYEYRAHDAEKLFEVDAIATQESSACISGLILRGLKKPSDCPAFGRECTPQQSARRHDGLGRGRLRRLLPVRPLPRHARQRLAAAPADRRPGGARACPERPERWAVA